MALTNSHLGSPPLHPKTPRALFKLMPGQPLLLQPRCSILWMDLAVSLSRVILLASSSVWTRWIDPGPDSAPCLVWYCWHPCVEVPQSSVHSGAAGLPSGQGAYYCLCCGHPQHPFCRPACWITLLLLLGDTDYVRCRHSNTNWEFSVISESKLHCEGIKENTRKKGEHKEHVKHCSKHAWNSCVPETVITCKKPHQLSSGDLIQEQFVLQLHLLGSR